MGLSHSFNSCALIGAAVIFVSPFPCKEVDENVEAKITPPHRANTATQLLEAQRDMCGSDRGDKMMGAMARENSEETVEEE